MITEKIIVKAIELLETLVDRRGEYLPTTVKEYDELLRRITKNSKAIVEIKHKISHFEVDLVEITKPIENGEVEKDTMTPSQRKVFNAYGIKR